MGPKKKGEKAKGKKGAKKGGSGKTQVVIDGVPVKSMSRDQLEGHVARLRGEVDLEREERNFLQCEVERLQRLWEVSVETLEETRGKIRLKEAEMAATEKNTQNALRSSQRNTKALMDEQDNTIGKLQVQGEQTLLSLQKLHLYQESKLEEEINDLSLQNRNMQANYLSMIATLKVKHSKDLDSQRCLFEDELRKTSQRHLERMQLLQEQLDMKRQNELTKLQEERSSFLSEIIKNHQGEVERLTEHYADVTNANLRLTAQLRTELNEQRNEGLKAAQLTEKTANERASLQKELKQAKKELADSQRALQRASHLSVTMKSMEGRLRKLQEDKRSLQSEIESRKLTTEKVGKERDDLYDHFVRVVAEVHQRSQMKNKLLEDKLNELSNKLEKRDAVLSEVVQASNLDPKSLSTITRQLEEIIEEKNKLVSSLQEEMATMKRMYTELLSTQKM